MCPYIKINPVHALQPIHLRFILILPFYLSQGFPSGLFPSVFPKQNLVIMPLLSNAYLCPARNIVFDFIVHTLSDEEHKSRGLSLCRFLDFPPNSIGLRYLTSTQFSIFGPCSSFKMTDQVSHAYKTTAKFVSVANRKSKDSEPSGSKYCLKLTGPLLLQA